MELRLILPPDQSSTGPNNLKNFIAKANIEGLEKTEVERAAHQEGQMGVGTILNSVKTVIEAATEPLVELVKCLQLYVQNYRTEITIPTKTGNVVLSQGRSMTTEEMKELVTAILQSNT